MIDLTRLEAVNEILAAIGESPVASLAPPVPKEAALAEAALDRADRELQTLGWGFNTNFDDELTPVAGEIVLPANTLRVQPTRRADDFSIRGGKLYDGSENTFTFTSSVRVNIVIGQEFTDLPIAARNAIVKSAARKFAEALTGETSRELRADELAALSALRAFDAESADYRYSDASVVGRITGRPSPMDGLSW